MAENGVSGFVERGVGGGGMKRMDRGKKTGVWILEDEEYFASAVGRLLESRHFEVQFFVSAELLLEALAPLSGSRLPTCIVADLGLPGMDGLELMKKLAQQARYDGIAVVAMSGSLSTLIDSVIPYFAKDQIHETLIPFLEAHLDDLIDVQVLKRVSQRTGIPVARLGRVDWFDATRGWGLLRVIGRDQALFVNASDIIQEGLSDGSGAYRFEQLWPGEVVAFEPNEKAPRGPRAERVQRLN
jgi:CheY-like chemotaxis protein/cold shock CspA family protein